MDKLGLLDASFLYAETTATPMHIAGLQHFEVPPGREEGFFEDLKAYIAARVHLIPFMTRRLEPAPLGLDHPLWVVDEAFDIDHHVQRTRVPSPGTPRQLEQVISRLHEQPLDRSRPLWQFWLVEGLESGHVVWYTKYHHACIDGMAGQAIIDILFSDTPESPPAPARPAWDGEVVPGPLARLWGTARDAATRPLRSVRTLPALARTAWRLGARAVSKEGLGALGQRAPRTRFNAAVGPYRTIALGSLPLPAVKAVGRPHGCKVNDVFLAVCAEGLARYLAERGELPERPLVAGAPVSLRAADDQSMSNQVTMLLTSLETHRPDPLARMLAIRDSAERGKGVVGDLQGADIEALDLPGLPLAFRTAVTLSNRLRLGDWLPVPLNLVISNVPGPRREVFLAGARMLTHYPVSIAAHGAALNVTVQSYRDRLDFSLTACLDTVPDAVRLRDHMLDAWEALQRAAGIETPEPPLAVDPAPLAERDSRAA
jgi:WS/DGAT/MGAT family acyltransferase